MPASTGASSAMASTPCSGSAPAASTPWLSISYQAKPPCSVTTSRPVHSTRMQASGRCRAGSASAPALSHSSSITPASSRSPRRRAPPASSASAARSIAAKPDFMSAAPRPYMRPSRTTGSNASGPQGPTTSRWPSSIRLGPSPEPGSRPTTLGRPGSTSHTSTSMPRPSRRRANHAANAPSPGPPARPGFVLSMRTISARRDSSSDMCSSAGLLMARTPPRFWP